MLFGQIIQPALCFIVSCITAAALPTSTAPAFPLTAYPNPPATTPAAQLFAQEGLRERQDNDDYVCGWKDDGGRITCVDHDELCAATLAANNLAYQYCSAAGSSIQDVDTTQYAYGLYSADLCPTSAYCWYATPPLIIALVPNKYQ